MTDNDTLQTLALEIIFNHFADCDYQLGSKVISDVMVIWTSKLVHLSHDRIKELDRIIFSRKASEQKQVWDITGKWSKQYWEYYRLVEHEKNERFAHPVFTLGDPKVMVKSDLVRGKILETLQGLDQDTGIRFMSILTVEWARRFSSDGFLQMIRELGHSPSSESIADGSYVTVSALWFMDIAFQMEGGNEIVSPRVVSTQPLVPPFDYTADQIKYVTNPDNYKDSEAHDLARVILNLGASGDPRAVMPLIELLDNKLWVIKYGTEVEGYLYEDAIHALRRMGELAIDALVTVLLNTDGEKHHAARIALQANSAVLHNEHVVDLLLPSIHAPNSIIRNSIVWVLVEVGTPRAMGYVIEMLADSDAQVRSTAAILLRNRKIKDAIPALLEIVQHDPDSMVRSYALEALVSIGDARVIPVLAELFPDLQGNPFVRNKVKWAIAQLGNGAP